MKRLYRKIQDLFEMWLYELKAISKDSGAILFCFVLPLAYPILYSWIYNNEVVREVPIVVVDNSHTSLSREFIQKVDASPDVDVSFYAGSINEAKKYISHCQACGIMYFPEDFAVKVGRMEQAHVSLYCDMSYMLTYKAIFQTVQSVSGVMGAKIKTQFSQPYTSREAEISTKPLDFEEVPIFNTTGGYGNFVLPAVLVLVIQQALLLSMGLLVGTERENYFANVRNVGSSYLGKGLAFFMIFAIMLAYTTLIVPRIFGFVMMVHFYDWMIFMTPYLMACIGFSIIGSSMISYRENVMLTAVITSVPFLFLSGISWPQSAIPGFWQGVADILPSTFAVRGFVRMSSMGARIGDVLPEFRALCMQAVIYNVIALLITYRRYNIRWMHIEEIKAKEKAENSLHNPS